MNTRHVCVVGLGYIGLPTAAMFARDGFTVHGVDINPSVVARLRAGEAHFDEPELGALVRDEVLSGRLVVDTLPALADSFIIAVPTPANADHSADLGYVRAATESIVPFLRPGNLVVLESTSPPGTTANVVRPILERSGLTAGLDFSLAYSPERVLPGQILRELVENDRVVGGIDSASAAAAARLYGAIVKGTISQTTATTAEMVKLMENTSRDVSIALANEFALIAERLGIDVWEAISLANRHPRVNVLQPGPGVGGHCIAVDPWFLVESAPDEARIIRQAREINDRMPSIVVRLLAEQVGHLKGAKVAVLGLAYKANVGDTRESPAIEVVHLLHQQGAIVALSDDQVEQHDNLPGTLVPVLEAVDDADCVLILTNHTNYAQLDPGELGARMRRRILFDTRRTVDAQGWQEEGFQVRVLGVAGTGALIPA